MGWKNGWRHEDNVVNDPVSALVVATLIGAGSSVYSAQEQKKSAKKAREAQENQAMEARRIQAEQKPMDEQATLGTQDELMNKSVLGSLGLTVNPDMAKKTTGLSTTAGSTGLGFSV